MKIERLEIKTRNLKNQLLFYGKTMGFEIINETNNSFEVETGSSVLKFIEDYRATPYHIAFHIPPEQSGLALSWVKERVQIQRNGQEEIVYFNAWNAMSLYFYDADKNILEFISRKELFPLGEGIFSAKSVLAIAEIGLATNDISEKFNVLSRACGLGKYDGNFENFCAIGDDEGLVITIDKNKKDWFPTSDKAFISDFVMIFKHNNERFKLIFENDQISITPPEI